MAIYYVATISRYVLVDAESEEEARNLGQVALQDLYADVRAHLGRDFALRIHTLHLATAKEIEVGSWHDMLAAREQRRQKSRAAFPLKQRAVLGLGIAALLLAVLPMLGADGGSYWGVPSAGDYTLPHFDLLPNDPLGLYSFAAAPLHALSLVPGFYYVIYYDDVFVARPYIRPFLFVLFWSVMGVGVVWASLRPPRKPIVHVERNPWTEDDLFNPTSDPEQRVNDDIS
jgi:hypothetical protein